VTTAGGAEAPAFTEPAPRAQPQSGGVLDECSNAAAAARRTLAALFDLFTLEAQRAGLALAWMVALGVGAAILAVTAWLGTVTALVLCAVALGLAPIVSLILMVALNLAGAAVAAYFCVRMSKDLRFPSSRRQLASEAGTSSPQP